MRIRYGAAPIAASLILIGTVTASAAPTFADGNHTRPSAVVQLASSPQGPVLVTGPGATAGAGMALYEFSGDAFPAPEPPQAVLQFNCTATNTTTRFTTGTGGVPCTTPWPPLMATGALVAGRGVSQAGLSTATAGSGFTPGQVEYFGHPLYTFVKDTPGTFSGENVAAFGGLFWLVRATAGLTPAWPRWAPKYRPQGPPSPRRRRRGSGRCTCSRSIPRAPHPAPRGPVLARRHYLHRSLQCCLAPIADYGATRCRARR